MSSLCLLSQTISPSVRTTPRTFLFPSIRSATFHSATCLRRAQLFPKPLCIYMSTPRPPLARMRFVRWGRVYGGLRTFTQLKEERRRKGKDERKRMRRGRKERTVYAGCNATTRAACNAVVESLKSALHSQDKKRWRERADGRVRGNWGRRMATRRQESETAREPGVDELC